MPRIDRDWMLECEARYWLEQGRKQMQFNPGVDVNAWFDAWKARIKQHRGPDGLQRLLTAMEKEAKR